MKYRTALKTNVWKKRLETCFERVNGSTPCTMVSHFSVASPLLLEPETHIPSPYSGTAVAGVSFSSPIDERSESSGGAIKLG